MNSLLEQTPPFAEIGWWFRFQDELNLLGDIWDVRDLQVQRHPAARSLRIDRDREFRFFSIDGRLLEKKRFSPIRRFHFAVRPFCNEQIRVDRYGDAFELALFVKSVDELSK